MGSCREIGGGLGGAGSERHGRADQAARSRSLGKRSRSLRRRASSPIAAPLRRRVALRLSFRACPSNVKNSRMSRTGPDHGRCLLPDTGHNDDPSSGDRLRPQCRPPPSNGCSRFAPRALASLSRPKPTWQARRVPAFPRGPSILRIAFFSPPTEVCSLPSAWSAVPSACFLSGCAAQSSAAGADQRYGTQTV